MPLRGCFMCGEKRNAFDMLLSRKYSLSKVFLPLPVQFDTTSRKIVTTSPTYYNLTVKSPKIPHRGVANLRTAICQGDSRPRNLPRRGQGARSDLDGARVSRRSFSLASGRLADTRASVFQRAILPSNNRLESKRETVEATLSNASRRPCAAR